MLDVRRTIIDTFRTALLLRSTDCLKELVNRAGDRALNSAAQSMPALFSVFCDAGGSRLAFGILRDASERPENEEILAWRPKNRESLLETEDLKVQNLCAGEQLELKLSGLSKSSRPESF